MRITYHLAPGALKPWTWGYSLWSNAFDEQESSTIKKFIPANCYMLHIPLRGKLTVAGQTFEEGVPFIMKPTTSSYTIVLNEQFQAFSLFFKPSVWSYEFKQPNSPVDLFVADQLVDEQLCMIVKLLKTHDFAHDGVKIALHEALGKLWQLMEKPGRMVNGVGKDSCDESAINPLHFCERHFRRKFKQTFGLPPQKFLRLERFQKLLALGRSEQLELQDLVVLCGYYDLAHLNREFKSFTGVNPKSYYKQKDYSMEVFLPVVHFSNHESPELVEQ